MASTWWTWQKRALAGVALVTSAAAGLAAFLGNIENIRGRFTDKYVAPNISIRDPSATYDTVPDPEGGAAVFATMSLNYIIDKNIGSNALNCSGKLNYAANNEVREFSNEPFDEANNTKFPISESIQSVETTLVFSLGRTHAVEGLHYDFRLQCDGIVSNTLAIPFPFAPGPAPAPEEPVSAIENVPEEQLPLPEAEEVLTQP